MPPPRRDRFISLTAASYAVLASLWIFLSDYLLSGIADIDEMVWMSTAKGMVFIVWSTVLFYFALQAVPSKNEATNAGTAEDSVATSAIPHLQARRVIVYVFAIAASLAMLWVHFELHQYELQPLLMLFMPPIVLSALFGGLGPGLAATLVAALGTSYLGIASHGGFRIDNAYELFRWALLIINGILISALSEKLRSAYRTSEQHLAQLSNSQEQLKALSDNLPGGMVYQIMVKPDSSRFVFISAGVQQLTGLTAAELLNDGSALFRQIVAEDQPHFQAVKTAALQSLSTFKLVVRLRKPDNELRYIHFSAQPRRLDAERVVWDGIAIDATEHERMQAELRKLNAELERRVAERTTALTQANKSLESFSQIVAHDLRVPLRHLEGFVSLLKQDYSDRLDANGRQLLENLSDSRKTMSNLIEGMLAVTRLEHTKLQLVVTDLSALATATARTLMELERQRKVNFVLQPGLTAIVDKTLMKNVFDNLLGNAWKFTAAHRQARIEFGAIDSPGKRIYFVRDDGAGFDQNEAEKLFNLFHRLHSQTQFGGTGIGLASVKSIIANHGGAVWAEGAVERGATIYFTLAQPAQLRVVNTEYA